MEAVKNIQSQMLYKKFSKKNVDMLSKRDKPTRILSSSTSSSSSSEDYLDVKRQKSCSKNSNRLSKYEIKAEKAGTSIFMAGRNAVIGLNSDRSGGSRNKTINSARSPFD